MSTDVVHFDNVAWHDAPLPPRLHRCREQTVSKTSGACRCACGGMRFTVMKPWILRNERRNQQRGPWWTLRGWRP